MQNPTLITLEHLKQAGVNPETTEVDKLLSHLNDQLEERIGAEITASLDDEKLNELLDLQEKGDDEAIGDWLETNVPELQKIAEDERDILLGDLTENSNGINENS